MRRFLQIIIAVMALVACGDDRTVELEEKTQHNRWLLEQMRDRYLWAGELGDYEPDWKVFFAKPADFLQTVAGKVGVKDRWSYVTIDTVVRDVHPNGHFNHINSYGFDFVLMNDPTGSTTRTFARVLTVYKGSPAEEAGLRRDDFISSFDGYKLSQKNTNRLERGSGVELTVQRLGVSGEEFVLVDEHTVRLGASRQVADLPYPVCRVLRVGGLRVGYLMCTCMAESPAEAMAVLRQAGVDEMVIDLRLCNDGTLDVAQQMASCLVSPECLQGVFARVVHNAAYAAEDAALPYLTTGCNLGLRRVFVLTSDRTQGAAEWMIHCMKRSMGEENVICIGKATAGQNVMTEAVGSAFHVTPNLAVAFVADADGNGDYGSIAPAEAVDETSFAFLGEYGEAGEPMLSKAIEVMLGVGEEEH